MEFKAKIGGKIWNFILTEEHEELGNADNGSCDNPDRVGKRIVVRDGLSQKKELDIFIHEMLHAAIWVADESWVEKTAQEMAHVLYDVMKWRKTL